MIRKIWQKALIYPYHTLAESETVIFHSSHLKSFYDSSLQFLTPQK